MKFIKIIICIYFTFSLITVQAKAYDVSDLENQINSQELWNSIPDEIKEYLPESFTAPQTLTEATKKSDYSFLTDLIISIIKKAFPESVKFLLSTVFLMIVISVLNAIKNSFLQPAFSTILTFISSVVLALVISEQLYAIKGFIQLFIEGLNQLTETIVPITVFLYGLSGNFSTASVSSAGFAFILAFVNKISESVLFPLITLCFALSVAGSISNIKGIDVINGSIKKLFTFIITGAVTLLSVFTLFKTGLALSADGMAARGIKFAGSLIPVVGSALGETVRSLMSAVKLIKSSLGFFGILIALTVTLPPIITLLINLINANILTTIAYILKCDKEGGFLKEYSMILGMIFSSVICLSVAFIFMLTIFITSPTALGGL